MLLPEMKTIRKTCLYIIGVITALTMSGCQIQPLYGTGTTFSSSASQALSAIEIPPPKDRTEQMIRNELVFAFNAPTQSEALYRLNFIVTKSVASTGIEEFTGSPSTRVLNIRTTYTLIDIESGEEIDSGISIANASYDWTLQRFANLRAEKDAEERAAKTIARDVQTRVAIALNTLR